MHPDLVLTQIRQLVNGSTRRRHAHNQQGPARRLDAVVPATGYRAAVGDFLVGWEAVCDSSGTPTTSGAPTALDGLNFCGMYVSPAGMLRQIRLEAARIGEYLDGRSVRAG
jgi:hypothetical protein